MGCTVNAGRVEAATCLESKGFGKDLESRMTWIWDDVLSLTQIRSIEGSLLKA
jgi:hypothetical protein